MNRLQTRKSRLTAGAILVVVAAAGGAYAYWTTTGSGTGEAVTATSPATLTITQTGPAIVGLAPGTSEQEITGAISNGGDSSVAIGTTVTVTVASITGGGPTCEPTDYTVTDGTASATTVGASDSVDFSGATIAFNDKPAENQDDCKGATVNLAFATTAP